MSVFLLPDRFEALENQRSNYDISKIIVPVDDGLEKIQELYEEMSTSGRGAFLILKGRSGCGKTTFLNTVSIFMKDVEVLTIDNTSDVVTTLQSLPPSRNKLRIVVIEGRESLLDFNVSFIDKTIHTVNSFIRSRAGNNTLVVWPCNNEDILEVLVETANNIGGTSLLGIEDAYYEFNGPSRFQYVPIAKQTLDLFNDGKTLLEYGLTDEFAAELLESAPTIGEYLKLLNSKIRINLRNVERLARTESSKLWIVVLAGNEPSKDVAALTKGALSAADINRLIVATNANIVEELKQYPQELGILANYFDCRIIFMPILTTLAVIRDFADTSLKEILKNNSISTTSDGRGIERLLNSELANMINSVPNGMDRKGKTGPESVKAFEKHAEIASKNDKILNETFGHALVKSGLINDFSKEADFGQGLKRRTDLLCRTNFGDIRLEFMWRKETTRAEIANYTLTKLYNYGKAIGVLK
ncbi:hypothetical protein [Desulfitobacterium metallireducens]|uniref:Uncharacterized protein n=1 Tax=Desulfitobacterium metallireducens DSM 15288 TaxID=871968 RepID=W0EGV6_9FIRM|nr:hypothetical protein [Desulfitobacterium metallireducens]AHF08439.1 hypothetical protein DESME_02955 [Desulfitobacterium metallireducens DSM 15288]